MKLANYLAGEWVEGSGPGIELVDPVTGEELARISSQGADLEAALDFARREGGPRLQQLTYRERAEMSCCKRGPPALGKRSEEHTSELQSRFDLVCRLLLEK